MQIKDTTLDQRIFTTEAALALGVVRPPERSVHLLLDGYAMIMGSMLNCLCGLELKQAAHEVREHWKTWLQLLTQVERSPHPHDPGLFIGVAWRDIGQYEIMLGERNAIEKRIGNRPIVANFLSLKHIRRRLKANAEEADITLPKRLTVAEGEPRFEQWWGEIDAYRKAASERLADYQAKRLEPA
jgi:hypothetical protein